MPAMTHPPPLIHDGSAASAAQWQSGGPSTCLCCTYVRNQPPHQRECLNESQHEGDRLGLILNARCCMTEAKYCLRLGRCCLSGLLA